MSQVVVKFTCSRVERRGLYRSFMRPKGMGFFLPKKTLVVIATLNSLECPGVVFWVKGPLSGGSGSPLFLAVGLWRSLTQTCLLDWEEGGVERRVEVICFNFHWLVFLWHSSKIEMESDCLFKVSSVHCRRYSSRKE